VHRRLAPLAAAAVAAAAMGAALALTAGTASTAGGPQALPASGSSSVPPSVVLEATAARPAQTFDVRSVAGDGIVGSARVRWEPRGDDVCPQARVPLGGRGTELRVEIDTAAPFAGGIRGSLYAPHAPCTRAVGTWRGTSGDYAGRDGGLVVALEDDGLVRMVFSP
jgi:hypothetical protein